MQTVLQKRMGPWGRRVKSSCTGRKDYQISARVTISNACMWEGLGQGKLRDAPCAGLCSWTRVCYPRRMRSAMVLALAAVCTCTAQHPRLWFTDVAALQAKVSRDPFATMVQKLQNELWLSRWANSNADLSSSGDMLHVARRHAFAFVLTSNNTLCDVATSIIVNVISGPLGGNVWANASAFGLTMYDQVSKVAMVYDFCFGAMNASVRAIVSTALVRGADVIVDDGGSQQNTDPASNWQGGRGSSALIAYLSTDSPFDQSRFHWAINHTTAYLQANYGEGFGWNIESLGYNLYPSPNFIMPAALALLLNTSSSPSGPLDLRDTSHGGQYLAMSPWVAGQFLLGGHLAHPDWTDDNANWATEGLGALSFAWMDMDASTQVLLPGIKHMYDKLLGPSVYNGNTTWDHQSSGIIWSILYYRDDIVGVDPAVIPAWSAMFDDSGGNGKFVWRSSYSGQPTDILAAMYAKLRGGHGHSAPDAIGIRLTGLNNSWIIGGGRYGSSACGAVDCFERSQTTLYPMDPDSSTGLHINSSYTAQIVGNGPVQSSVYRNGGALSLRMPVSDTGVQLHTRRFLIDYSGAAGEGVAAAWVMVDSSVDGMVAQFNTLDANAVSVDSSGTGWLLTGLDGASMHVAVLWPQAADLNVTTGMRTRAQPYLVLDGSFPQNQYVKASYSSSARSQYRTFLFEGTVMGPDAAHPVPTATSIGGWDTLQPRGTVTVGGLQVSVDGDAIAVIADSSGVA